MQSSIPIHSLRLAQYGNREGAQITNRARGAGKCDAQCPSKHSSRLLHLPSLHPTTQTSLTDPAPAQVLATVRSLTSSLFGIAAGILGLESYAGFIYFILGTLFVSFLIWLLRIKASQSSGAGQQQPKSDVDGGSRAKRSTNVVTRGQSLYFENAIWELWMGGNELWGGLSSFVLTWTLFYGIVRP